MADGLASDSVGAPSSQGGTAGEPLWVAIPIDFPGVGENASFQIGELELLFCNAEGAPYVVRDACPHVNTSLQGGVIRGTVIECPLHGGQMDLRDGAPVAMPIRRPGTCFPVRQSASGFEVGLPR